MPTALLVIFALLSLATANAGDYLTDFEAAKKKAAKENKPLLVKFTGSDWCPPCKALHKNVFSKKSFKEGVEKKFVVVVLDFPRKSKQSDAEKAANKKLAKQFKVKAYPTVLLMSSKEKVFKTMSGYSGDDAKKYLSTLNKSLKAQSFR